MKKNEKEKILSGTFLGNNRGFGFVRVEGIENDFFVSERDTHGALHMDEVLISVIKEAKKDDKSSEAKVVKIKSHGITKLVGTYHANGSYGFVIPDNTKYNKDIFIGANNKHGAKNGMKVMVEIYDFGDKKRSPEGDIKELLGYAYEPGVDVDSVILSNDLPVDFPDEVKARVLAIPDHVREEDLDGRVDLREYKTVTIDGEDTKDFDDAVTLRRLADGYELGVHIADVSHYVKENSPLDKEALNRGTSVYFPDRVIPMLPVELSNGICSLNEGEDRLCLSCIMTVDERGNIVSHRICETVINVDRRMTYNAVSAIIERQDEDVMREYADLVPTFELMLELSNILRTKRELRGSVDFDFPESKITLDERGRAVDVSPFQRNRAHLIIEDFMLAANETVAEDYFWQELPFEYRIHEKPDPDKLKELSVMMKNFGHYFKSSKGDIHPKEIQKLLAKVAGTSEEAMLSKLTLRCMKQARYSTECVGHFGLATSYYCHFTSPIRRYPDLMIHRIIKENLHGKLNEDRIAHFERILPKICEDNSTKERRADDAEREVDKIKKAGYMIGHLGESYEGVISGVTAWGFYVELPNTIEGLVHVTDLCDDYYYFDEKQYAMVGREHGRLYTLGNTVRVIVDDVDEATHTVNFVLDYENDEE